MRSDAHSAASSITDPAGYAAQTQLGREIADILRRNVVQGVRVEGASEGSQEERWRTCYSLILHHIFVPTAFPIFYI